MNWDEDDEVNDDSGCDPEQERKRVESLPIYQKAEELGDLTRRIIDSIDDEKIRMVYANTMLEDSMIIPDRIAAAEAVNDYIGKMENATIVKIHARSLLNQSASMVFDGSLPKEYLIFLQKEIEQFKLLFREWVSTFGNADKRDDDWGLFYP
jgi:hypothetical protein